jgi:hypothetical protein
MKRIQLAMFAATIAFSSMAFAGENFSSGVSVTQPPYAGQPAYASGSIYGARHAADPYSFVGCQIVTYSGSSVTAYCYATDSSDHTANCMTTDANQIHAIESLTEYTYIYFSTDGYGHCSEVDVDNYSFELP